MKFLLKFGTEHSDGFEEHFDIETTKFPGAYQETRWVTYSYHERKHKQQKAMLDESGVPYIGYEEVIMHPPKFWMESGRNHNSTFLEGSDGLKYWTKEMPETSWYVNIETVEELDRLFKPNWWYGYTYYKESDQSCLWVDLSTIPEK